MLSQASHGDLAVSVARLDERVESLEAWQNKQNGTLQRLESKVDRLILWMLAASVGAMGSLSVGLLLYFAGR